MSNGGVTLVRFATTFALLLPLLACKREAAATFGEPTGLQLSVDGTNVQVAVATSGGASNGSSVTSSVNTVASGFHGALKACPEAVAFLKKGQGFRIQFAVVDGNAVVDKLPSEAPVVCVLKALHGKTLFVGPSAPDDGGPTPAPPGRFNVLAEIRQGP